MKDVAFPVYFNWYDLLKETLTPRQRCEVIDALRDFYETGADPTEPFHGPLRLAVGLMRDQIIVMRGRSEKASESGKLGAAKTNGKKGADKNTEGNSGKTTKKKAGSGGAAAAPKDAAATSGDGAAVKKEKEKEKKKEKVNENEKLSSSFSLSLNEREREEREEPETPSLTDVYKYVRGMHYSYNPQKFFDYYEAVGWADRGRRIVDWRSKADLWELREDDFTG